MTLRYFLLDANLSPETAYFLRSYGYMIKSLLEQDLGNIDDQEVANIARQEKCILITFDLDFGEMQYFASNKQFGVIVLRLSDQRVENVNRTLYHLQLNLSEFSSRVYTGSMKHHIALRGHDSIHRLERAVKKASDPGARVRLKAIILRKRGQTPQEIAERLVVTDRSVTGWITRYNQGGIPGLATKPSGRKEGNPKWPAVHFERLAQEIDHGGYWSIPRMQAWLATHYAVNIPEQTIWYRLDQLNYSYKGARPHPAQGSKERQEAFKKGGLSHSWSR